MKKAFPAIEPLEARIAPASLTFTDIDGDLVTISSSKGTLDQLKTATGGGGALLDHQLQELTLSFTTAFDGATISIKATPQKINGVMRGDGFVNVGRIDATGRFLGSVTVDGDLGVIDVGNTTNSAYALQTLTVHSMGLYGTSTGAPDLSSDISGSVKAINVKTELMDAYVQITGAVNSVNSSLGALTVGGSIRAATSSGTGAVYVSGNIGPISVGGSLIGGSVTSSGSITCNGTIGNLDIDGDVLGGGGFFSGLVRAPGGIGNVTIGGDLRGADTSSNAGLSGAVLSGKMGNLRIGGSLVGSVDDHCGVVNADSIKNVSVGGSVIGSNGLGSGAIVALTGSIGNVTIGGDLKGGSTLNSGSVVAVDGTIGNVTVRGSLKGGTGAHAGSILAAPEGTHGSLGAVKIGGDVDGGGTNSNDLAGTIYGLDSIAAVTVNGTVSGDEGYMSGTIFGGRIGAVSIGKRLSGFTGYGGGSIISLSDIGPVTIDGDVSGYNGEATGTIVASGSIASVTLGGSLKGGAGDFSGSIRAASLGPVSIARDVIGDTAQQSGSVRGTNKIASVVIGGTVLGGGNDYAGSISSPDGLIGSVAIGGSLRGNGIVSGDLYTGAITGHAIGSVSIKGDMSGSVGLNSGAILSESTIGNVTIGGDLVGNAAFSGRIGFFEPPEHPSIGNVTIGGSVFAIGAYSGGIYGTGAADERVGTIKVGGDWTATNPNAGQINVREVAGISIGGSLRGGQFQGDKIGSITIGGDMVGGSFASSSEIVYTNTTSINITGSILGGTADFAGHIGGKAQSIVIGHDLRGADITSDDPLYAGSITGTADSILIKGSLIAGFDHSSDSPSLDGAISVNSLGSLVIKGSIIGNTTMTATIQSASLIKSVNVGGRVEFGVIHAYQAGAQFGSLTVGGDWIASNAIAGLNLSSNFGNGSDSRSVIGASTATSKIASISIAGQVLGTADPSRTFGFGAEEIGSFKVNGFAYPLKPGAHTDKFAGPGQVGSAIAVGVTPANLVTMSDGFAVHVFEV